MEKIRKYSKEEMERIVIGYVEGKVAEDEAEKFIRDIYINGLTDEEVFELTDIMAKSGYIFKWEDDSTIDKHSTGGVGDKVTIVLMPLLRSLKYVCPKMSGRSLGYTGGTADKLESIKDININLDRDEYINLINTFGLGIITQTEDITPADKKIYDLRDRKNLTDSIPLIASSIMSKKIALGAKNLILEVTFGEGAFMKTKEDAVKLGMLMKKIGKAFGINTVVNITSMDMPLGRTIGNRIEILEAIRTLMGEKNEVRELCVDLVYTFTKKTNPNISKEDIYAKLDNNEAINIFNEMLKKQGVKDDEIKKLNKEALLYTYNVDKVIKVYSEEDGYVKKISAKKASHLAFEVGTGRINKEDRIKYLSGLKFNKIYKDEVKNGDLLLEIYVEDINDIKDEDELIKKAKDIYEIQKEEPESVPNIYESF